MTRTNSSIKPPFRRLRGYAFDPSLSAQLENALMNEVVFKVRWEDVEKGPVGEYLEVVDYDPASRCFYGPIDLNEVHVLAQDGLTPSEGNPKFHQQMVYAVAMTTIENFERALGRWALWNWPDNNEVFIQRLRIYPHALRAANAYYSPRKIALLFGYFTALPSAAQAHIPGGMVFTCLSHDIIAHETTHALLDGMNRRFIEPTQPDALAFHEAFADIVALFQHFSFASVLERQIARTRGDLKNQNMLGRLAQQFGEAVGHYGALRDAIGRFNPETRRWERLPPEPEKYQTEFEPHARGALLVAAVFDAFLAIYEMRIVDLLRIATSGTGVLPAGEIHPDLVKRLASEAAKASQHVLTMCIRALDYCPPVDITFGDYLRAIITADYDLVPDDDLHYRVAFAEAFRRRGIYPTDVRTMSVESLRWPLANDKYAGISKRFLKSIKDQIIQLDYATNRKNVFEQSKTMKATIHEQLKKYFFAESRKELEDLEGLLGLNLSKNHKFEIHTLRRVRRVGPDGQLLNQAVVTITQREPMSDGSSDTFFRGGCSLVLDLESLDLRYRIVKPIQDEKRRNRQQRYEQDLSLRSLSATYFRANSDLEAVAALHRSEGH